MTTDMQRLLCWIRQARRFCFQTEEVLSVLDYAILVISATDGVTSYAKTLWNS